MAEDSAEYMASLLRRGVFFSIQEKTPLFSWGVSPLPAPGYQAHYRSDKRKNDLIYFDKVLTSKLAYANIQT